jgi:hypothetical protein
VQTLACAPGLASGVLRVEEWWKASRQVEKRKENSKKDFSVVFSRPPNFRDFGGINKRGHFNHPLTKHTTTRGNHRAARPGLVAASARARAHAIVAPGHRTAHTEPPHPHQKREGRKDKNIGTAVYPPPPRSPRICEQRWTHWCVSPPLSWALLRLTGVSPPACARSPKPCPPWCAVTTCPWGRSDSVTQNPNTCFFWRGGCARWIYVLPAGWGHAMDATRHRTTVDVLSET